MARPLVSAVRGVAVGAANGTETPLAGVRSLLREAEGLEPQTWGLRAPILGCTMRNEDASR